MTFIIRLILIVAALLVINAIERLVRRWLAKRREQQWKDAQYPSEINCWICHFEHNCSADDKAHPCHLDEGCIIDRGAQQSKDVA